MSTCIRALILLLTLATITLPSTASPTYPWAGHASDETHPLSAVRPTPSGFVRVSVLPGSLEEWLRHLPMRAGPPVVHSYDGRELLAPAAHVLAMDVGTRDLQQCADSAIRLLSEFAWARGDTDRLGWHFTSGDRTGWSDWVAGERFVIGGDVERRAGPQRSSDHESFRSWLDLVFTYAGTRSLAREGEAVGRRVIRGGDVFVAAGSPGHAVLVLDVAVNDEGQRIALLGQGFMPAQEFHVLKSDRGQSPVIEGTWFLLPVKDTDLLDTPSWRPFTRNDARRLVPWLSTDE